MATLTTGTAAPVQEESEETECQLHNLSRGPNRLMGTTRTDPQFVDRKKTPG